MLPVSKEPTVCPEPSGQQVLNPGTSVMVEVPATSANLGPGFDCFGLALDWRERVRLAVIERGYQIEVSGEGAGELPRDESHLIVRSALVGLADLGVRAPGLWLGCRNTIPHGRGLGSSSAAIVAGLVAAGGLAQLEVTQDWLLGHANAIEGHPDNVAAAIYGGFVLAYQGRAGVKVAQGHIDASIGAALFIPQTSVATTSRPRSASRDGASRGCCGELRPSRSAGSRSGIGARSALRRHQRLAAPGISRDSDAALLRAVEIVTWARACGDHQWCRSQCLGVRQAGGSGCAARSTSRRASRYDSVV